MCFVASIRSFDYTKAMKSGIIALFIIICPFAAHGQGKSHRAFGIALNGVPAVADSSAGKLYFSLPPDSPDRLSAQLTCTGNNPYIRLNGKPVDTGTQASLEIDDWPRRKHILSQLQADGTWRQWEMCFTTLPLVCIDADTEQMAATFFTDKYKKHPGFFTLIDPQNRTDGLHPLFAHTIGIRIRGASSSYFPKKSFSVEFRNDREEPEDIGLLNIRRDDDWILDAMYIDRARMRNRVATDIWNEINDLPYAKENTEQCNGTHGQFVEVFVNGSYHGLYCLTDKIDRKKLNLKKTKNGKDGSAVPRGLLYKGRAWTEATILSGYRNEAQTNTLWWEGWEQKYPDDSPQAGYWEPMKRLIDKIAYNTTPDTTVFRENVKDICYLDNVVDYIILINSLLIQDNQLKNAYISFRNIQEDPRMLLTPWDMDASFGRTWDGQVVGDAPHLWGFGGTLINQCCLFYRMIAECPDDFMPRIHERWNELKKGVLAPEAVSERLDTYARLFERSGAWRREARRWPEYMGDLQEEMAYCKDVYQRNTLRMEEGMGNYFSTGCFYAGQTPTLYVEKRADSLFINTPERQAQVSITDMAGRTRFAAGCFPTVCRGLGKGIYLIRLTTGTRAAIQKITIP